MLNTRKQFFDIGTIESMVLLQGFLWENLKNYKESKIKNRKFDFFTDPKFNRNVCFCCAAKRWQSSKKVYNFFYVTYCNYRRNRVK